MKVDPVVAAIIIDKDRFLLGRRAPHKRAGGYWAPVSGRIEPGETQEQAVVREVREEVGLEVVVVKKLCIFPTRDQGYTIHWWLTRTVSGTATLKNEEHTELGWFTLKEMETLNPFFQEDLEAYRLALEV